MQVIYQKACGVDVHKSFIVAVICDSTSVEPKYIRKRFSTYQNSLIQFREWLISNDCQNVCMESTGKYYIPVYNALEGHISNVVVANPKWVRAIKDEKDDNKDAKWIADLFKLGFVRSSFIPSKDIRVLRELTRYLYKLTCMTSSEKNRYQNALTVGNCKIDMVFSDVFGKSASAIINLILSNDSYSDEEILSKIHGRCKSSKEDILEALESEKSNKEIELDLFNFEAYETLEEVIKYLKDEHFKRIELSDAIFVIDAMSLPLSHGVKVALLTIVCASVVLCDLAQRNKMAKKRGAFFSALGTILPSFIVILTIAIFFVTINNNPIVERVFKGIRPAVVALIIAPVFTTAKAAKINVYVGIPSYNFADNQVKYICR